MEANESITNPVLERIEAFGRSGLELLKLKSLALTADAGSTLVTRLLLAVVIMFFIIALNIAISLWLGELLGKNYYGFLIIAAFYALLAIIFYFAFPVMKQRINNSIIKQTLN